MRHMADKKNTCMRHMAQSKGQRHKQNSNQLSFRDGTGLRLETQELHELELQVEERQLQERFARQLGDQRCQSIRPTKTNMQLARKLTMPSFTPSAHLRGDVMRAHSASEVARERRQLGRLSKQLSMRGNFEEAWHRSQAAAHEENESLPRRCRSQPTLGLHLCGNQREKRARLFTMAPEPRPNGSVPAASRARSTDSFRRNRREKNDGTDNDVDVSGLDTDRDEDAGDDSCIAVRAAADEMYSNLTRIHRELDLL